MKGCSYFVEDEQIDNNTASLSTLLNGQLTYPETQTLNKETIDTGAEMFIFLNSCPREQTQDKWKSFFNKIIADSGSVTEILLTLMNVRRLAPPDINKMADHLILKINEQTSFSLTDFKQHNPNIIDGLVFINKILLSSSGSMSMSITMFFLLKHFNFKKPKKSLELDSKDLVIKF